MTESKRNHKLVRGTKTNYRVEVITMVRDERRVVLSRGCKTRPMSDGGTDYTYGRSGTNPRLEVQFGAP